ncbi:MAG: gamma-glutamyl-gamma-aminobutyrate hydrolase family protein [Pseudomonadales bacterium]|nr:gamma-glutamyl-gamma-aminobutyrate hydrolase family protein [Pseudomonadales bacterium]
MKIAILEADHVADELRPTHGDYPTMFTRLLLMADSDIEFETFTVIDNQFPSHHDYDAFLITGSKFSAYEQEPWILALIELIKDLHAKKKVMLGICFGHQLIAIALGGNTEKAQQGWGVGNYLSELLDTPEWMQTTPTDKQFRLLVSHQDQVVALPTDATLLGRNDFCPNAMYQIEDHVLTFQGHPEFSKSYSKALMDKRREAIGEEVYQKGIDSLQLMPQGELVAKWMYEFVAFANKK